MTTDALLADPCGKAGAQHLAAQIITYWRNRGYSGLKIRIEPVKMPTRSRRATGGTLHPPMYYCVRSNIGGDGYPPS